MKSRKLLVHSNYKKIQMEIKKKNRYKPKILYMIYNTIKRTKIFT